MLMCQCANEIQFIKHMAVTLLNFDTEVLIYSEVC